MTYERNPRDLEDDLQNSDDEVNANGGDGESETPSEEQTFRWVPERAVKEGEREKECIMGIDEAGRGPVLGPMVYGCAIVPMSMDLSPLGFADSKVLTDAKRREIYTAMRDSHPEIGFKVDVLSARTLSTAMRSRQKTSLNVISHHSAAGLIRWALSHSHNLHTVYVDTVGDPTKYESWLQAQFPSVRVCVSKKADSRWPVVGAASIVAKVTRDVVLEGLGDGGPGSTPDHGSGYPGDPATKSWLQRRCDRVFGYPEQMVRWGWSTAQRVAGEKACRCEWDSDEEGDGEEGGEREREREAYEWFKRRRLEVVEEL